MVESNKTAADTYSLAIFRAIRRLQQAAEIHSKRLSRYGGLTPLQLLILHVLAVEGELTATQLAKLVSLSQASLSGVLDRLEGRGLLYRRRDEQDRRKSWLHLDPAGHEALAEAPPLLPEYVIERFAALPEWERHGLLDSLDLGQYLDKDAYKEQLAAEQARLAGLIRDKRFRQHSLVAVFEGNDAAGKGGAIRRVTDALDPRQYHIVPIAAPTEEERAQPYLWRFWRHIPARRQFTIFDRSWYGRVLVERIEGFCAPADWLRAYGEINDFEEQLSEYGIIVVKFWLAIDKQTQMERFKEREKTPYKRYKITEEDWRNRDKWDQYVDAVGDMVDRTSTEIAPWTLVEANDKRFARVKVLRTINDAIEAAYKKDK